MNRIVIFEAPDNCGKDTQIKLLAGKLAEFNILYHVLHYSSIPNLDPVDSQIFSRLLYDDMFSNCCHRFNMFSEYLQDSIRLFILNRSHIGENVYAPMYRKTDGSWIFDLENNYKLTFPDTWGNIYLITFIDKPENLINREDGKSFSIDIDKKKEEIARFMESTNKSHIENKIIIDINDKDPQTVHKNVLEFLKIEDWKKKYVKS